MKYVSRHHVRNQLVGRRTTFARAITSIDDQVQGRCIIHFAHDLFIDFKISQHSAMAYISSYWPIQMLMRIVCVDVHTSHHFECGIISQSSYRHPNRWLLLLLLPVSIYRLVK